MINCAHPTHFEGVLDGGGPWLERIRGAARQRLDAAATPSSTRPTELDEGDPVDLGAALPALRERLPQLTVLGGCCGTDHRHVEAIRDAWLAR